MRGRKNGNDAGQLLIDWAAPAPSLNGKPADEPESGSGSHLPPLELPWDFRSTFPSPTEQAIDAGLIDTDDVQPERLKAIHDEHEREASAALRMIDRLSDARRHYVDFKTGRRPRSPEKQDTLHVQLTKQIDEAERWWSNLMAMYADAFGADAADAFAKAIKARHAGVTVVAASSDQVAAAPREKAPTPGDEPSSIYAIHEAAPPQPGEYRDGPSAKRRSHSREGRRVVASLPVPKPLDSAIESGQFGTDEHGPIRPTAEEVREITENHANQLIELRHEMRGHPPGHDARTLSEQEFARKIDAYAADFGKHAADRLDAYARRQAHLQSRETSSRSRGR